MNNEKECLHKDQPEIKYVNKQSEIERLEKENTRLEKENHRLAYSLSQSVPVESSLEQYDRIKELEEILNSEELLRQHMNSIGYRELFKLKEELQATREQLSKAEQRIFHLSECSSLWEYQGICDCGYEKYFKEKDEVK